MESGVPAGSAPSSTNFAMNVGYRTCRPPTLTDDSLIGEPQSALDLCSAASGHFRGPQSARAGGHCRPAIRGRHAAAARPRKQLADAGVDFDQHHLVRRQRVDGPFSEGMRRDILDLRSWFR